MEQADLIRYAIGALESIRVPYMVVGSFAGTSYGEHRFTADIDVVIELPLFLVSEFCKRFPNGDFYISESAVRDSARKRFPFNVLHPASGNKLDFMYSPDTEWGRGQLARRRRIRLFPDLLADVASPEDVILGKLWYHKEGGSVKHIRDISGILRISGGAVDRTFVTDWAERLGYSETWNAILNKVDSAT